MKRRKVPKGCPLCKSKHFSYEQTETEILRNDSGLDYVETVSEWVCGECDEIFYHTAQYRLGELLKEEVNT